MTPVVYYVHYTVDMSPKPPQHLVTGPYSEAEVLDERRYIAAYNGVTDVYISETNQRTATP